MNKKLLILAVAGLALASCSNDEVIESVATSDANVINFSPLVKNVTRAADLTTANLNSFTAFATETGKEYTGEGAGPYFPETVFTKNGTTFTSTTKYYWPSSGALDFYAYSFSGADGQVTHTAQTKAFIVTPSSTAANQTDLIFANTNNKTKDGAYDPSAPYDASSGSKTSKYGANGVPLNFRHAESKITIKLKNSNSGLKFTVGDVIIKYLNTTGTYTYSGSTTNTDTDHGSEYLKFGDWTAKSGTGGYTQTPTTTSYTSSTAATALPQSFILIPQELTVATVYSGEAANDPFNAANITVDIKVQNADNDAYILGTAEGGFTTAMWPLPAGTWNPGYHYIYTVDLAGGGYYPTNQTTIGTGTALDPILEGAEIKFVSVTVDVWNDQSETVVNAGN